MKKVFVQQFKLSVKDVAKLTGLAVTNVTAAAVVAVARAPMPGEMIVPENEVVLSVNVEVDVEVAALPTK